MLNDLFLEENFRILSNESSVEWLSTIITSLMGYVCFFIPRKVYKIVDEEFR